MPEFRKIEAGGVRVALEAIETRLLRQVACELRSVLTGHDNADDPVTTRLFPAAYECAEQQAEYIDLVGDDLKRAKLEALDKVTTAVANDGAAEINLCPDDLGCWLATLTDIRLAIGARLDVNEEMMEADVDPTDPNAQALTCLHWLGWLQDGILRAVS